MSDKHAAKATPPAPPKKQNVVVRDVTTGDEIEIPRGKLDAYLDAGWDRIDPDPGLTGYETTPADEERGKS